MPFGRILYALLESLSPTIKRNISPSLSSPESSPSPTSRSDSTRGTNPVNPLPSPARVKRKLSSIDGSPSPLKNGPRGTPAFMASPPRAGSRRKRASSSVESSVPSPKRKKSRSTSPERKPVRKPEGAPEEEPKEKPQRGQDSPGSHIQPFSPRPDDPSLYKQRNVVRSTQRQAGPRNHHGRFWKFPTLPSTTSKGFFNPQNFCYRNAVLQLLFHSPPFYRYMGKTHVDCHLSTTKCLTCTLQAMLYTYWNCPVQRSGARNSSSKLLPFIKAFNTACRKHLPDHPDLNRDFRFDAQADADEFLRYLLLDQIRPRTLPGDQWSFREMFEVDFRRSWTCNECEEEHVERETELGLVVHLDREVKMELDEYWAAAYNETMPRHCGSEQCAKVYNKQYRQKHDGKSRDLATRITHLPKVLFLHIRRFAFDPRTMGTSKIGQHLDLPETIDLFPYVYDDSDGDQVYRLDGVVGHLGSSLQGGHYIAAVRKHGPDDVGPVDVLSGENQGEENENTDRFHVINDDKSIHQSEGGNLEEMNWPREWPNLGRGRAADSYIAVYSRIGV